MSVLSADAETTRRPSGVTATAMHPVGVALQGRQQRARSRSQTLSVLSSDAETTRRPSGVTATALTQPAWPSRVASSAPRLQVPDLERLVVGRRDHAPAVRRHRHAMHPVGVALQGRQQPPGSRSQTLSVLSSERRDHAPAVRRHRHRAHQSAWPSRVASSVPCSRSQTLSVLSSERRDHAPAVRRHRHRDDPAGVALQGRQQRARSRSQTLSVWSSEAETTRRPSGVTATAFTPSAWPSRVASSAPVLEVPDLERLVLGGRDHAPPVRRHRHRPDPSRRGPPASPAARPVSRSHTLSVLSAEAETTRRPSGVTAHAHTQSAWPSRVASTAPRLEVPDLERPVLRRRDHAPPVRRHRAPR